MRHLNQCRFRLCNSAPAGCTVWIRSISLPKPGREVRLAASRVAMPQSHVMLTQNPQRFAFPTVHLISASCRFSCIKMHDAADKKSDASPQRDRSPHRRDACSLRRVRSVIHEEPSSQHVDRSSIHVDRSGLTSSRVRQSVVAIVDLCCSLVSTSGRLRVERVLMRYARRRFASCGSHIASCGDHIASSLLHGPALPRA